MRHILFIGLKVSLLKFLNLNRTIYIFYITIQNVRINLIR